MSIKTIRERLAFERSSIDRIPVDPESYQVTTTLAVRLREMHDKELLLAVAVAAREFYPRDMACCPAPLESCGCLYCALRRAVSALEAAP